MKLKRVIVCGTIILLCVSTAPRVNARPHVGSNLPLLGDVETAIKFVNAGDAAARAGKTLEAIGDYHAALTASPFYEDAEIGLARCSATEGDDATAIANYRDVVDNHHEEGDIDIQAEYILVLTQADQGQDAIPVYNRIVDLCKKGYCASKMDILPPKFSPDGSNYDADELQAMTHLMRAMNSSASDYDNILSEIDKATALAPDSPLVSFYQGVVLNRMKKSGAKAAFQRALALDDGTNAKVINKWIAISKP